MKSDLIQNNKEKEKEEKEQSHGTIKAVRMLFEALFCWLLLFVYVNLVWSNSKF